MYAQISTFNMHGMNIQTCVTLTSLMNRISPSDPTSLEFLQHLQGTVVNLPHFQRTDTCTQVDEYWIEKANHLVPNEQPSSSNYDSRQ